MNEQTPTDQAGFRRILARNVVLPLIVGIVGAGVFVALVLYVLSTLSAVDRSERVIGHANEIAKLGIDLETGVRGFLLTDDDSFLAPYQVGKPAIETEMARLAELVRDNPVQVDRLKKIAALQVQWDQYAQEVIGLRRRNLDYQQLVRSERGKQLVDAIRRELGNFTQLEERVRRERNDEARQTTIVGVTLYVLLTLTLSGLLAWFGRRELTRLSDSYSGALAERTSQADALLRQGWLREGQTQLAEQILGRLTLAELGRATLSFLARRLDVVVAALYARTPEGVLQRIATYGFGAEGEQTGRSFRPGEGLPGQAALEHRTIRLAELPPGYLKVNSALGDSAPKHVLVLPIDNDGSVNGVLEAGFVRPLAARDEEFFQLVAGSIGAAMESAVYRQRLQELLTETQQLNEELQVQQEELRTANEELEEQSRELKESQVSLENQQAELEQTNEQLAGHTAALDQKNAVLNRLQIQLEQRADELQKASRYKSEFLANMSHELRTPLNSSLILAKLLADNEAGNLNPEQVRFAQSISAAGNDLLHLINDILDISKVEAGKLELVPEDVPLQQVVVALQSMFEPLARDKSLAFTVELDPRLPATLHTDRQRLEQILKNLLSNAIKFTEHGSIVLGVRPGAAGRIEFAVRDSGVGIAPEAQQHIFEAFHQGDGTTSRRYGGTGLGLSISRDLTGLLGGTLVLHSVPGQGSTFTLDLPVRWQPAPARTEAPPRGSVAPAAPLSRASPRNFAPPAHAEPPRSYTPPAAAAPWFADDRQQQASAARTVLVIEDDPQFAQILYDLAHEMKYRCLVAQGADEGIGMATRFVPDAILLDFGLPDKHGLGVLHRLKEDARTRHIPVHVVSGEDRSDAAMHLGAIGYAQKPTTREELKAVFARLEEKFTQRVKRVLLVEDDALQRESIVHLIGDDDIEITAVERGEEALQALRTSSFDCMIIDLKLPDMQGNDLLRRMSAEETFSFPPV
ncbi:MAG: CHASE3 domain-containing protein, partial [Caldimonas sp.]